MARCQAVRYVSSRAMSASGDTDHCRARQRRLEIASSMRPGQAPGESVRREAGCRLHQRMRLFQLGDFAGGGVVVFEQSPARKLVQLTGQVNRIRTFAYQELQ